MFFETCFHDLGLPANPPDSNLTLHTAGNDPLAVVCSSQGSHTMVVSVINGKEKFSRLRHEGPNLAIIPSREDALAIILEADAEALKPGHFDTEKLLARLGVPHPDIVERASSKEIRLFVGESN
jgi:hypothetical protein